MPYAGSHPPAFGRPYTLYIHERCIFKPIKHMIMEILDAIEFAPQTKTSKNGSKWLSAEQQAVIATIPVGKGIVMPLIDVPEAGELGYIKAMAVGAAKFYLAELQYRLKNLCTNKVEGFAGKQFMLGITKAGDGIGIMLKADADAVIVAPVLPGVQPDLAADLPKVAADAPKVEA